MQLNHKYLKIKIIILVKNIHRFKINIYLNIKMYFIFLFAI